MISAEHWLQHLWLVRDEDLAIVRNLQRDCLEAAAGLCEADARDEVLTEGARAEARSLAKRIRELGP